MRAPQSSAGTRAASGRRRPARDHAFIAYRRVPSPPPGTTPAPIEDVFTSAVWGVVVSGGPVGHTRFGFSGRWSLSLQSPPLPLSPSRPSRTCVRVGPPATGSGPTRPAGLAVAGRRPSYPSRVRVERAATRGAAGRGARCPSAAGAAPGQVCAAGPSRPVRASLRAGGWDQKKCAMKGAHTILKPEMSWFGQVYIPWLLWPVHSTSFTPG